MLAWLAILFLLLRKFDQSYGRPTGCHPTEISSRKDQFRGKFNAPSRGGERATPTHHVGDGLKSGI